MFFNQKAMLMVLDSSRGLFLAQADGGAEGLGKLAKIIGQTNDLLPLESVNGMYYQGGES